MRVELESALDPLVLALDVGSIATRGGLYDAAARPVRGMRHKVPHHFTTSPSGASEIDPDAVVREVEAILVHVAVGEVEGRVRGVALDTFASSLVGVDTGGRAVTPCYTYADSRNAAQAEQLRRELDEAAVHQRTGCRLHTSYLPARLRWLTDTAPDVVDRVDRWLSLGEYVHLQLLGTAVVGTSTAAWTGMLDRRTGRWDAELLRASGARAEQLSEVRDPEAPVTDPPADVARRWPALAGAAWFPVVTDGFASNIGAGAAREDTIAASAATSGALRVLLGHMPEELPAGLWCYRVGAGRWLLGGALNDVGRVVTWLESTLRLSGSADLGAVLAAPPEDTTPVVLPYLTGERSPGWATGARAVLGDVSVTSGPEQLFRGAMEGVALAFGRVADPLQQVGGRAARILASGRVSQELPDWLQVLADVLDAPVEHVTMKRTTLRGTALLALEVLAPDTPRSPADSGAVYTPYAERAPYYAARRHRFQQLYEAAVAAG
ncbi:gluconokinase [Georgenia sp. 10Sc9-8]|uniref:Gluconokinase n=1 Tax=Georgenia halotolerans TaxID=3028317 RepID=A0ABT5U4L8_9MICO|nr:gluconokinase [Georgenia halotolerans]